VSYTAEPDPLCYPGTTVLKNLLNIEDQHRLDEAELALFLTRTEEPAPAGEFDVRHYLDLHRHLFQDIYSWAGEIRTVRIGKGGNWFCYPEYIVSELNRVFAELGDVDELSHMPAEDFAKHVAHFIAELNAVHPFREGNGRAQLAFLAMLTEHAGFAFDEEKLDRNRVMQAMIQSFSGDEGPLVSLIQDIVAERGV
jgi:cell filamentation protein